MNTPNPLLPQGSLQNAPRGNPNVRIAVFTIIAIHAVFFGGLLMQGCKRNKANGENSAAADTNAVTNALPPLPSAGSNAYYSNYNQMTEQVSSAPAPPLPETNAAPPPAPASTNAVAEAPAPSAAGAAAEYTVKRGDIAFNIARRHHITLAALKQANPGVDLAHIKVNQKIQIPVASAASSNAAAEAGNKTTSPMAPEVTGENETMYVVKAGDTLSRIARRHGVSVRAIKAANHLKSDRISVAQKLKIPAAAHAAAAHSETASQQ